MLETFDEVGSEQIYSCIYGDEKSVSTIMIYGGGLQTDHTMVLPLVKSLEDIGIDSLIFDFSGQGKSSSNGVSSLKKRVEETQSLIRKYLAPRPVTVIALSMGAYIAIKLLETQGYDIENLILFCPAVYTKEAYDVDFGPNFSELLRQENSWLNTDAGKILEKFKGNVQIFYGSQDTIVPPGIIDLLTKSSSSAKIRDINIYDDCDHKFLKYMTNDANREKIVSKIKNLIYESNS